MNVGLYVVVLVPGHAIAWALRHWLLTVEALVLSWVTSCEIYDLKKRHWNRYLSESLLFSPTVRDSTIAPYSFVVVLFSVR
jgi:hypothetical protein